MKIAEMSATLVDSMGTDLSVVNAARVSFAKESTFEYDQPVQEEWYEGREGWDLKWINGGTHDGEPYLERLRPADAKLINYLAKHNHITPFMHCFATFRMKAPIFVARQLVKHQIGLSWNEESRRYIDEEPEFWLPILRMRPDGSIKQGSGEDYIQDENDPVNMNTIIESHTETALLYYNTLLNRGIAPEQARMVLPLNTMTNWIWSGSLAAWARVANLRLDPHAQLECQEAVKPIAEQCKEKWPVSWAALTKENN